MRKKLLLALPTLAVAALLSSCSGGKMLYTLYNYGGMQYAGTYYENIVYNNEKNMTPETLCALVVGYEDIIQHPTGLRKMPPPGICAEYGYLLLKPGTATTFAQNATDVQKNWYQTDDYPAFFKNRGIEMLKKEIELYPESKTFIEPFIEKLSK